MTSKSNSLFSLEFHNKYKTVIKEYCKQAPRWQKQTAHIVNEESDLALIKPENNDASQKVTSSKKTTEQLATSSKQQKCCFLF